MSKTTRALIAATLVLSLGAAACAKKKDKSAASSSSSAAVGASSSGSSGGSSAGSSGGAAAGGSEDSCDTWKTVYGDIKGKTISLYTSIIAPEDQPYKDSYKPFEDCTGAKIKYEGSKEFEEQVVVRTKAGTPPDVALLPQPGLLKTLVATGKVKEAPAEVAASVDKNYDPAWKELGSVGGKFYAAPNTANVKSFVWYSPKAFKDKGYAIPQTFDELIKLSDKIAADDPKSKPWCAGFGSGVATGWPGTDWLEDMMLRTAGPDVYDKWVKHEIPFNDPQVADALAKVGSILKNPKYVNGGLGDVKSIATTSFNDGGIPVRNGGCYMHRQASFYANQFPKGTKVGEDGDVYAFYFPPIDPAKGKPVLGAGEFTASFSDRPEVKAFQLYLTSSTWVNAKAKASSQGGFVSPHKGLDVNNVVAPVDKLSEQILLDPKAVFRFDGSDLMPSAVGAGTLWKGMTDWITGKSDKDMLDAVEASWPK
jgi:alpha-glucoside transport system substrate-binding protein